MGGIAFPRNRKNKAGLLATPLTPHIKNVEEFLKHCHQRKYRPKSTLVYTGDKGDSLYYIVKGSAMVVVEDDEGHEMIVAYLNAGDFFGEMGLFDDQDSRTAWVRSKTDCELAEISYSRFNKLIETHPEFMFALASQMARRLRNTTEKVRDLAFLDVTGRIARTLLNLAKEPDAMSHPDGTQIKITRQEIANIVGCTREVAGKVLKALEDQGLLSAKGKTLVIFRN